MRTLIGVGLSSLILVSAAFADGEKKDEKIDFKKLIGKWEPADNSGAVRMVIEFAEKNKVHVAITESGKTDTVSGTYTIKGNTIDISLSFGGQEQKDTLTVSKLTDDELIAEDSKKKTETLKRVKAK